MPLVSDQIPTKSADRKKSTERVKLYTSVRPKGTEYLLKWSVCGQWKKRSFADLAKAKAEKERLERVLGAGQALASQIDPEELATLMLYKKQVGDTPLHKIFQFWVEHNDPSYTGLSLEVGKVVQEFLEAKDDTSVRNRQTIRSHADRFAKIFQAVPINTITTREVNDYLKRQIGGTGRTRHNHRISLRALFHYAQGQGYLPVNRPTVVDQSEAPSFKRPGRKLYTPDQLCRILAFAPARIVPWIVVGAFTGARAAERDRLTWGVWNEEARKIEFGTNITKTERRRLPDVPENLAAWLRRFRGDDDERIFPGYSSHKEFNRAVRSSGLPVLHNALRSGYASYHLELFSNAPLTSKNCGHSIQELETTYLHIKGVTRAIAQEWFTITPERVFDYCSAEGLKSPEWVNYKPPNKKNLDNEK